MLASDGTAIYDKVERDGNQLMSGLAECSRRRGVPLHVQGLGAIFSTVFTDTPPLVDYRDYKATDTPMRESFIRKLQDHGVRTTLRGTWFVPAVLSDDDIAMTLDAADAALAAL